MRTRQLSVGAAFLLMTRLATAQVTTGTPPALLTPAAEPPPVTKSLEALDTLLNQFLETLPSTSPTISSPSRPVATRAQEAVARLRELSKKWPAQSPLDYRTNLDHLVRNLQSMLESRDRSKITAVLQGLAEDLEAKLEHCVKSGGRLGGSVTVRVRTVRGGQEVSNWQVFYLPRVLETLGRATADRFPQLSSPTNERLVPGRYVMWSGDPVSGRLSEKAVIKVGEGRQDLTIDLAVPTS
jgi:hypothetical protein